MLSTTRIVIIIIKLVIIINRGQKINFPETCSKQCWIFSSAKHNYVPMCITVKFFFEKVEKWKFKLALKLPKRTRGSSAPKSAKKFIFNHVFKILLIMLDLKTQLVTSSPCQGANFELSWSNVKIFVQKLQSFYGDIIFWWKSRKKNDPKIIEKPNLLKTCSKQCLIFSSAKHK